jgi:hypothetical protein
MLPFRVQLGTPRHPTAAGIRHYPAQRDWEARHHTVEATILVASQRGFQPRDPEHGVGVKVASCHSPNRPLTFRAADFIAL